MNANIRQLDNGSEKDLVAVATFEHDLKEEIGGRNTAFLEEAFRETRQEFESMASFRGRRDILVAEVCGKPIGYLAYKAEDCKLEVECFYMTPFFRGYGIGTTMIKQVLETAGSRGLKEAKVFSPLAESRKMYEKLGFRIHPRFGENCMILHLDA